MMPVVRISDATFSDLKLMASWFGTKTPAETLDRVIREAMDQLGLERDDEPTEAVVTSGGAMEFEVAPGLAFTKPLSATINGKPVQSPRWSSILMTMIAQLKARGLDGEKLVRELRIPAKALQFEDEGFQVSPTPWHFGAGPVGFRRVEGGRTSGQEVAHPGRGRILVAPESEGPASRLDRHSKGRQPTLITVSGAGADDSARSSANPASAAA